MQCMRVPPKRANDVGGTRAIHGRSAPWARKKMLDRSSQIVRRAGTHARPKRAIRVKGSGGSPRNLRGSRVSGAQTKQQSHLCVRSPFGLALGVFSRRARRIETARALARSCAHSRRAPSRSFSLQISTVPCRTLHTPPTSAVKNIEARLRNAGPRQARRAILVRALGAASSRRATTHVVQATIGGARR